MPRIVYKHTVEDIKNPPKGKGLVKAQSRQGLTNSSKIDTSFTTVTGSGEPLAMRCGHSSADTEDLENLFLDKIHAPLQEHRRRGDEISSFYIKRSRHRAFFGAVNLVGNQQGQSTHSAPAPEQRIIVVAPSSSELSGSASAAERQDSNPNESSQVQAANRVVQPTGRVVRFKEDSAATQEVPYEKEAVNKQARVYANQGRNYLKKQSTVHGFTTVQPVNGKRHYDQDLPERLQPMTKEAFEFEMEESEEEL